MYSYFEKKKTWKNKKVTQILDDKTSLPHIPHHWSIHILQHIPQVLESKYIYQIYEYVEMLLTFLAKLSFG